jgi:hypothetical protein
MFVSFNNLSAKKMTTAHVVNLDRRTDRWANIQDYFKDTPLKLERTGGVIITNPFRNGIHNQYEGVARTHYELVKRAKKQGYKTLLMLEDDCKPEKDFVENWTKMKTWLDLHLDEWDTFNGGALGFAAIQKHIMLDDCLLFETDSGCASHFVYFNVDRMLPKLEEWFEKQQEIDVYYFMKCKTLCAYPPLAIQDEGYSDIALQHRTDWKDKFYLSKLFVMRYLHGLGIAMPVDL